MSNISFVTTETPFSVRFPVDVFGLRTMVDLAGLAIMFAHQSRISELVAEREAAAVNTALNAQYDQYRYYLQGIELINIKLASQFFIHMSSSFWLGLVLTFPIVLYLLWTFVAPALYPRERRGVKTAFLIGCLMFFLGVAVNCRWWHGFWAH